VRARTTLLTSKNQLDHGAARCSRLIRAQTPKAPRAILSRFERVPCGRSTGASTLTPEPNSSAQREFTGENAISGSKKPDFSRRISLKINYLRIKFRYAANSGNKSANSGPISAAKGIAAEFSPQ
jgi:hypothetical protein